MPDQLTPTERFVILARVERHVRMLLVSARAAAPYPLDEPTPESEQFVRESIADACHAIDAAVADVPTEEEIASARQP